MTEYNVRAFGAVGDGVADDCLAIRAALSAAEAAGGGCAYVPAGVYGIGRHAPQAGLFVSSDKPLRIRGDGMGASVLRMLAGTYVGDFHLLRAESDLLELDELTLDGNRSNIPQADEQTHLVQLRDCRSFAARRVEFRDAKGDGIKAVGSGGALLVDDLLVEGCTFRNNGRSGITVQRAVRSARILGCYFVGTSDQDIDFEPTGSTAPSRIVIADNVIEHSTAPFAVTLSGISGPDRTTDVLLVDNVITGGRVGGIDMRNVVIRGNRIAALAGQRCLDLTRGIENVLIEGNVLSNAGAEGIYMAATSGRGPVGVTIRGNTIATAGSIGVLLESCAEVLVEGNRIADASGAGAVGVQLRATAPGFPVRDALVASNVITGFARGVYVAASQNEGCEDVGVVGNVISNRVVGGKTGVEFAAAAAHGLTRMTAVGNAAGAGISKPLVGLSGAPAQSIAGSSP